MVKVQNWPVKDLDAGRGWIHCVYGSDHPLLWALRHFKFRWCDRSKKFILVDAFCQGCAGKVLMINPFPHQTTSFFNIKSKLRFRTPKPDLFTCLMIFVMYIIMPEFRASSQPGQHVRISKDRFTETVFLKNSNQVPAIVMVHFIVIIFLLYIVHFLWHHNLSFGRRIQIPESRFQNK